MGQVKQGDWVQVHYTGTLADGKVFDSSTDKEPLEFKVGDRQVISGFEQGVLDMGIGQSKVVFIPATDAYGSYDEELVLALDRNEFPSHITPMINQKLQILQPNGHPKVVTVIAVSESQVTLDANHPLAGKDLTFDIKLLGISEKPTMACESCGCGDESGSDDCGCGNSCCH